MNDVLSAPKRIVEVPKEWIPVFRIIKKGLSGGELSSSEKFQCFSIYGFLFGVFYYVYLGMWVKGLILCSFSVLVDGLIYELGYDFRGTFLITGIIFSMANYDYYQLKVNGQSLYFKKEKHNNLSLFVVPLAFLYLTWDL